MSSADRDARRLTADEIAELKRDMPKLLEEMRQNGELPPKPAISRVFGRLTAVEKDELRRVGREQDERARKAFEHLRSKPAPEE